MKVLVTGATGYIGGRLVPRLLEQGLEVRCMSRDSEQLALDPWRDQVEVAEADALDPASLERALEGRTGAYYLIHAVEGSPKAFAAKDRIVAENFRNAADQRQLSLDPCGSGPAERSGRKALLVVVAAV